MSLTFSIAVQSVSLPDGTRLDFRVNPADTSIVELHIADVDRGNANRVNRDDNRDRANINPNGERGTYILSFKRNGGPNDQQFVAAPNPSGTPQNPNNMRSTFDPANPNPNANPQPGLNRDAAGNIISGDRRDAAGNLIPASVNDGAVRATDPSMTPRTTANPSPSGRRDAAGNLIGGPLDTRP